jgi:uncharacterized protein (UPF0261 family)
MDCDAFFGAVGRHLGSRDSVPEAFEGRQFHVHNPQVTLMRTTPAENAELGEIVAGKLNAVTGPTVLVLPLEGVSAIDAESEGFHDPEADAALFEALRANLDDVGLFELDAHGNDEVFAGRLVGTLDGYMRTAGVAPEGRA